MRFFVYSKEGRIMKITCSKCGKRFNAEQHMYICPKCNHYHSQVGTDAGHGTTEKPVKKYRWETDPIELDDEENFFKRKRKETEIASLDPPTYPKSEMPDEEEPDFIETLDGLQPNGIENKVEESDFFSDVSSVGKKIRLAIYIIVGFAMLIGSTIGDFGFWSDEPDSWDGGWDGSYMEETVDYGDPMEFETFTVNVEGVSEPKFDGLEAEEGFKLVQVNFKTESPYEYETEDIITDVYLMHSYEEGSSYTEDGYCASYEDEIASDRSTKKELKNAGLVIEAHYSGEYFCIFEIPEEVEDVDLKITSFIPEEDDSWSYAQDECFKMPLEL